MGMSKWRHLLMICIDVFSLHRWYWIVNHKIDLGVSYREFPVFDKQAWVVRSNVLDVCYCSQCRTCSTMCTMNITSDLSGSCALTIFNVQELLVLQFCGRLCLNLREFLCVCLRKFVWHFFMCNRDVRINTTPKKHSHILNTLSMWQS